MSIMKDLFISMQEAYRVGTDIERETARRLVAKERQITLLKINNKPKDNERL